MSTFVHSTVSRRFFSPDGDKYEIPAEYIGEVPDWLLSDSYFKAVVADGDISYIGAPPIAVTASDITPPVAGKKSANAKNGKA